MRGRYWRVVGRKGQQSRTRLKRAATTAGVVVQAGVVLGKVVVVVRWEVSMTTGAMWAKIGCRHSGRHRAQKGHGDDDRPEKGGQQSAFDRPRHQHKASARNADPAPWLCSSGQGSR